MMIFRSVLDECVILSDLQYTECRIIKWELISLSEEKERTYSVNWEITSNDSYIHPYGGPRILRAASQLWVRAGL